MSAVVKTLHSTRLKAPTVRPVAQGVQATIRVRKIKQSAVQAVLLVFSDDREEWIPQKSMKAISPDGVGGLFLSVDLGVIEERGLRGYVEHQRNHVDSEE